MRAMQEFGKMAIPSSSGRAKRSVQEDGNAIFSRSKKQETPENSEKKEKVYTFSVLLPNGSNLTLLLENPNEEMTVAEFVRTVKRRCEKEAVDMGSRRIQWGNHVYLEDTMGNKLKDKKISLRAALDKITLLILQLLDELQRDRWPVEANNRAMRCIGMALGVAAGLLGACVPGTGARIIALVGGPCTEARGTEHIIVGTAMRGMKNMP